MRGAGAGRGLWRGKSLAIAEPLLLVLFALAAAQIVWEQVKLLPPRPPTRAEVIAATPKAEADWRIVRARLARRLYRPPFDVAPMELGAVWATRSGRICGLVNDQQAGVDNMTRFYTVGLTPMLQDDDLFRFFNEWMTCLGDYWVDLHPGTEKTGLCASPRGRSTVLGRIICQAQPVTARQGRAKNS